MSDEYLITEADWPMSRIEIDSIYLAIQDARMQGRRVIGVRVTAFRTDAIAGDWMLFGIDWVISSEPLEEGCFGLIYDRGPETQHRFRTPLR